MAGKPRVQQSIRCKVSDMTEQPNCLKAVGDSVAVMGRKDRGETQAATA